MTPAQAALALMLALPLLAALAAIALPRLSALLALAALAAAGAALAVLGQAVLRDGPVTLHSGGWAPPLGIALQADGLGLAFLAMGWAVVAGVIGFAAIERRLPAPFWPLAMLLWAALNAVFVSRDLFNLYVGLELLTLAAVALVALGGDKALAAALRYMFYALGGSALYLAGVVLVYAGHGTLDMALLAGQGRLATDALALALMSAGLMVKTALFPFHVWLPPAHAAAPATGSALLSALVPKASFLIMMRLWFEAMPDAANAPLLAALALLGTAAVVHGGIMALRQSQLKQIIAYSTVAQLGYLFLVFPLAGGEGAAQPWAAGGWSAAVFLALSHALAKAAMFLCAGIWLMAAGSGALAALSGLARALPMTAAAFGLASVTLMGLPPSGGFTAKYLMMTAAFASGQPFWGLVPLAGGLMAAAYLYRPMALLFARDIPDHQPVSRALQLVPLALALAAIALGIFSQAPYDLMQAGRPETAEEGL
ncbi:MAG: hypothetical protein JJT95_16830 [Pararhodobacter sp.]|nr:hypothetical protein [Pararhodobacter sp.]